PAPSGFARRRVWADASLMLSAALLPFIVPLLYFWHQGHFQDYWYSNFVANLFYVSGKDLTLWTLRRAAEPAAQEGFLLWTTVLLSPLLVSWRGPENRDFRRQFSILAGWLGAAGAGMIVSSNFWNHYFLQLM